VPVIGLGRWRGRITPSLDPTQHSNKQKIEAAGGGGGGTGKDEISMTVGKDKIIKIILIYGYHTTDHAFGIKHYLVFEEFL
jgi:hypothetical protein